jgi:hypothetical protein
MATNHEQTSAATPYIGVRCSQLDISFASPAHYSPCLESRRNVRGEQHMEGQAASPDVNKPRWQVETLQKDSRSCFQRPSRREICFSQATV